MTLKNQPMLIDFQSQPINLIFMIMSSKGLIIPNYTQLDQYYIFRMLIQPQIYTLKTYKLNPSLHHLIIMKVGFKPFLNIKPSIDYFENIKETK